MKINVAKFFKFPTIPKLKSCRFGMHDYGKWKIVGEGNLTDGGVVTGYYKRQERTCNKCGKLSMRRVDS